MELTLEYFDCDIGKNNLNKCLKIKKLKLTL